MIERTYDGMVRIINCVEDVSKPFVDYAMDEEYLNGVVERNNIRLYDYRIPRFISPSSLSKWKKDRREWILQYASFTKLPKIQQTKPMALGSAFDAFAKGFLEEKFLGLLGRDEYYLSKQVEIDDPSVVQDASNLFEAYKRNSLPNLVAEMMLASGKPKFEESVTWDTGYRGLVLMGKPDLFFMIDQGINVIIDWKVSGYYSKTAPSPKKGYIKIMPEGKSHKNTYPEDYHGITIDGVHRMEDIDEEWATQLTIYAWILGAPVGSEIIGGIEQLVGNVRIASYRNKIGKEFQEKIWSELKSMWDEIVDGNIDIDSVKVLTDDPLFARIVR